MENLKKDVLEKISKDVENFYFDSFVENIGDYDHFEVRVFVFDGILKIIVSRMYEYLPLNFKILKFFKEYFGTEEFDISNSSSRGCESCDYGSVYSHAFAFPLKKISKKIFGSVAKFT